MSQVGPAVTTSGLRRWCTVAVWLLAGVAAAIVMGTFVPSLVSLASLHFAQVCLAVTGAVAVLTVLATVRGRLASGADDDELVWKIDTDQVAVKVLWLTAFVVAIVSLVNAHGTPSIEGHRYLLGQAGIVTEVGYETFQRSVAWQCRFFASAMVVVGLGAISFGRYPRRAGDQENTAVPGDNRR